MTKAELQAENAALKQQKALIQECIDDYNLHGYFITWSAAHEPPLSPTADLGLEV